MREAMFHDAFFRCILWIAEVSPTQAKAWFDTRFPGLEDGDYASPYAAIDFATFANFYVYPAMIERFVPWLMPHWPQVSRLTRITDDLEFPKTGTALISLWRSDVGGVYPTGQPTHVMHVVLRDDKVYDPIANALFTVGEYISAWDRAQEVSTAAMRVVYIAEKPRTVQ